MIIRIDDVSANTDRTELAKIIGNLQICRKVEKIIVGVNLFAKECVDGSVYPSPPFKDKPVDFFYQVDRILNPSAISSLGYVSIASHGLIHLDHSKADKNLQEMSILVSCKILKSKIFIPPFNRYNEDTLAICDKNDIKILIPEDGWKNIDYEAFDPCFDKHHKLWYFHPWRWNDELFKQHFISKIN